MNGDMAQRHLHEIAWCCGGRCSGCTARKIAAAHAVDGSLPDDIRTGTAKCWHTALPPGEINTECRRQILLCATFKGAGLKAMYTPCQQARRPLAYLSTACSGASVIWHTMSLLLTAMIRCGRAKSIV